MIKAISAVVFAALAALAVTTLPGFAPQVKASAPAALAKSDRLPAAGLDCAEQSWPNLPASCLHRADSGLPVSQARLVIPNRS
jgi:hypothetical protein